ncbi:hypothetical protein ACROYT_G023299 [Oculina patagonica]
MPAKSNGTVSLGSSDSDQFPIPVESPDQDFVVKFKGQIISWKNISQLLRQHNITVPDEGAALRAVLQQKDSSTQSCEGRCLLEERRERKPCYCDEACKTFSDCCLDFYSRCGQIGNADDDATLQNVTCGVTNPTSWSGVVMKSSCGLFGNQESQDTSGCQTVQQLNLTLQKELPVFDWNQNVTYRSIACARCNIEGNLSFWGLKISCKSGSVGADDINEQQMKEKNCTWEYVPLQKQWYKSCVLRDSRCTSNQLPVMTVIKQLCSLYSMAFLVTLNTTAVKYRNPHYALCNPEGKPEPLPTGGSPFPPWSILLDVSGNIPHTKEPNNPQPTIITGAVEKGSNLASKVFNCTSNITTCTVTLHGKICKVFTLSKNQSIQKIVAFNNSRVMLTNTKQFLKEKNAMKLQGNTVYVVCPGSQADKKPKEDSSVLIYVTFIGTLLSIISLCFLLGVYLMFIELRNLPGKCLINLSLALLCYQTIFLGAAKSKEVDVLCKAVAIFLHFFILAAFSWMCAMAFDTANAFSVKGGNTRRQTSDVRKTFIKYCIVGWGLPAMVVGLCSVLDFTETFHFGYGGSTYCWISDRIGMIVAMVTPVSLALVFNVTCLTKNVFAIHHLQQGASLATTKSSQTSLILICIKLTTVMGLTWILGLIANWKQAAFLHYPSAVLNSMQGFFIALCFTTTKKVRGLLKERFYKRWNGAAVTQTSVTREKYKRNGSASGSFKMNSLSRDK